MRGSLELLRLLHLASPALPIGAFHFSQGLEYAVEMGWVSDEASARDWIAGIATHAVGTLDLPMLARMRRAFIEGDTERALAWSRRLLASRETEEMRAEDRHMGQALARILVDVQAIAALSPRELDAASHASSFARACAVWSIGESECLQTYLWAWCENQTLAAVKLVPLGQSAGQRILHALIPLAQRIAERALLIADEDVGTSCVMQAFASARHESQYTRLFRS